MTFQHKNVLYGILLGTFGLLGAYSAYMIYNYQLISNAILSVAVIYSIFSKSSIIIEVPIDVLLSRPNKIKPLLSTYVISFLLFLSVMGVYKMLKSLF